MQSLKLIQKKQLKVDEIQSILLTEISPQLEKLSKEKQLLLKYNKNTSDLALMQKQITAHDFHKNTLQKTGKKSEVDRLRAEGEALVRKIDQ